MVRVRVQLVGLDLRQEIHLEKRGDSDSAWRTDAPPVELAVKGLGAEGFSDRSSIRFRCASSPNFFFLQQPPARDAHSCCAARAQPLSLVHFFGKDSPLPLCTELRRGALLLNDDNTQHFFLC